MQGFFLLSPLYLRSSRPQVHATKWVGPSRKTGDKKRNATNERPHYFRKKAEIVNLSSFLFSWHLKTYSLFFWVRFWTAKTASSSSLWCYHEMGFKKTDERIYEEVYTKISIEKARVTLEILIFLKVIYSNEWRERGFSIKL